MIQPTAEKVRDAVERIQGCKATLREVEEVILDGSGGIHWAGPVYIFDVDHQDSDTCYVWSDYVWSEKREVSNDRQIFCVLGGPTVVCATEAVVAFRRERKRRAGPNKYWYTVDMWSGSGKFRTPAFEIPGDVWRVRWRTGGAGIIVYDGCSDNIVATLLCARDQIDGEVELAGPGRYFLIIDTDSACILRVDFFQFEQLPPPENIDWRF